jgi:4-oxalocrotonate tautomerase
MPFVKILVTREGVTREQKRQLIKGVTDVISAVLNKDPQLTHIAIEEVDTDNWGWAGEQISILREQGITADKK